jgi:hypothetical protein
MRKGELDILPKLNATDFEKYEKSNKNAVLIQNPHT